MSTAVASYARPTTAAELAESFKVFCKAEFGYESWTMDADGRPALGVDLSDEGDENSVYVALGTERDRAMFVAPDEKKILEAIRAKRGTFWPNVVAGFNTPTNAAEVAELLRLILDVCTEVMATSWGGGVKATLPGGEDVYIAVSDDRSRATSAGVVEAARSAARSSRAVPGPVAAWREPASAMEFIHMVRAFMDIEFRALVEDFPDADGTARIDFATTDASVSVFAWDRTDLHRDIPDVLTKDEAEILARYREDKANGWEPDRAIAAYRIPRTPDELVAALCRWLEDSLDLTPDACGRPWGGEVGVTLRSPGEGGGDAIKVVVVNEDHVKGEDTDWRVLSPEEAALVDAHRRRDGSALPQVIVGFKEPRNVGELAEILRLFYAVNFDEVCGYGGGDGTFQVSLPDGVANVVVCEAGRDVEILDGEERRLLSRYRRLMADAEERHAEAPGEDDGPRAFFRNRLVLEGEKTSRRVELDVAIMSGEAWAAIEGSEDATEWSGVAAEDGRIVAAKLVGGDSWGKYEPAPPEEAAGLRRLRARVAEFLEAQPDRISDVLLEMGGDGGGRFLVDFADAQAVLVLDHDRDR